MTLDYASFAHGVRDNEGKGRGPTLLEKMKKPELRHPHLKEELMCLIDNKMDMRIEQCFTYFKDIIFSIYIASDIAEHTEEVFI